MDGKTPVDFPMEGLRHEARELLAQLRGPEGERVRANAVALGKTPDKYWKPGGEASEEAERLLRRCVDDA